MSEELERVASEEEQLERQTRLYNMLKKQVLLFNSGQSTSVREEVIKSLAASIKFSLQLFCDEQGISFTEIPNAALEEILPEAGTVVSRHVKRARLQYHRVCRCAFREESIALESTIHGIGRFFRTYDPRFFAAECPCDIDYPLAHPVPETLRGVTYIRSYLDRLLAEDAFLRRFPEESVRHVLACAVPQHRELLVNLYEIVAVCALGVTLAEENLFVLDITAPGQKHLFEALSGMLPNAREETLLQAAKTLSRRLELNREGEAYLLETARQLRPRLDAAMGGGDLQTIFPVLW